MVNQHQPHFRQDRRDIYSPEDPYAAAYEPVTSTAQVPLVPLVEQDDQTNSTDTNFAVAFGLAAVIMTMIVFVALTSGSTQHLTTLTNFDGLHCGVDDPVRGLPYVYYPLNPAAGKPELMLSDGQCVISCPTVQDVGKPIPIIMTQYEEDPINPGKPTLVVKYTVQSPKYATTLHAGNLCLPMDKALQQVVISHVSTTAIQMKQLFGTYMRAWPAITRDVIAGLVIAILMGHIALPAIPRISIYCVSVAGLCCSGTLGIYALWWGLSEGPRLPHQYGPMYGLSTEWSTAAGAVMVLLTLKNLFLLAVNWGVIWEGVSAYKASRTVFIDLGRTQITVAILVFSVVPIILCGTYICSLLASVTTYKPVADMGGATSNAFSVHLQVSSFSWRICLYMALVSLFTVLLVNFCRSLARWCGAYVAAVWYYSPPVNCACDQRYVPMIEAIRSMHGGVTLSLGTNVLYAAAMPIFLPITQMFCYLSRRKSPNFSPPDGDNLSEFYVTTTPGEAGAQGRWLAEQLGPLVPSLASCTDFFHIAALTENMLSGTDLIPSMGLARMRLNRRNNLSHPPSAGRYIGSFTDVVHLHAFAIASFCALLNFSTVSCRALFHIVTDEGAAETRADFFGYTLPESPYFVSNPVFVSALVFVTVYTIVDIILGYLEAITDSVLYCYVMDVQSDSEHLVGSPTICGMDEHPAAVERCPAAVKILLMKLLAEELGMVQEMDHDLLMSSGGPFSYHHVKANSPSEQYHKSKRYNEMTAFDVRA